MTERARWGNGVVAFMALVPASKNTLELVEPCEQTLDLPSAQVSTQRATILQWFLRCGETRKLFIERIAVIGKIPNNSSGFSQRGVFIERSFDKGDVMWASRRRVRGE
ncbi:hypothetical protein SB772_09265 [Paraburkholderia sp. SIMBA_030]